MYSEREAKRLARTALKARRYAHAPYSGYAVGAALKTVGKKRTIYTGCNIENASYGATMCAERVAMSKALSEGVKRFKMMAVATAGREPAPPCGICLQFMAEFCDDLTIVLVAAKTRKMEVTSLSKLLPMRFRFE
jgi:cytidine deaminase